MGSAGQSGTLSPSLSLGFPRDLLITLESECSLALRPGRESKTSRVLQRSAQPPGTSQRRRWRRWRQQRPDVIYTVRLVLSLLFCGNRLLSWEINRRFSLYFFTSFFLSDPSRRRRCRHRRTSGSIAHQCDRTAGVTMADHCFRPLSIPTRLNW